nr:ferulate 5-hydroxylase [Ipomoea batatas]
MKLFSGDGRRGTPASGTRLIKLVPASRATSTGFAHLTLASVMFGHHQEHSYTGRLRRPTPKKTRRFHYHFFQEFLEASLGAFNISGLFSLAQNGPIRTAPEPGGSLRPAPRGTGLMWHCYGPIMNSPATTHPFPLLLHETAAAASVNGYHISGEVHAWLINAWAIGRDKKSRGKTREFQPDQVPERTRGGFQREQLEFIPFGRGGASCPGMQLGLYGFGNGAWLIFSLAVTWGIAGPA